MTKVTKKPKKITISKVTFGLGNTKSLANCESLRVFTEIEAKLEKGKKVAEIQKQLRELADNLNKSTIAFVTGKEQEIEITVPKDLVITYLKSVTIGQTKNLGGYEFLKINNGLESPISKGQDVLEVHAALRDAVLILNENDFNTLLNT